MFLGRLFQTAGEDIAVKQHAVNSQQDEHCRQQGIDPVGPFLGKEGDQQKKDADDNLNDPQHLDLPFLVFYHILHHEEVEVLIGLLINPLPDGEKGFLLCIFFRHIFSPFRPLRGRDDAPWVLFATLPRLTQLCCD